MIDPNMLETDLSIPYFAMDVGVMDLCHAINCLPGIETVESCEGHLVEGWFARLRQRIFNPPGVHIWMRVSSRDTRGLAFLTRCVDDRYFEYGHHWVLELEQSDCRCDETDHLGFVRVLLRQRRRWWRNRSVEMRALADNMIDHVCCQAYFETTDIDRKELGWNLEIRARCRDLAAGHAAEEKNEHE